ncbi:MAG: TerC family protein, partial [Gammaproteobacteria bacterium]|nr:TerC family protein [Gammaproteobacteria bacterium]
MLELLTSPEAWAALITLTALEIVLGVDNIIFLTLLVSRLPGHLQDRARFLGIAFAGITRIGLLLSLTWVMRLSEPLFTLFGEAISGRDLVLIGGGLFLLWKAANEIYVDVEAGHGEPPGVKALHGIVLVVAQIAIIDIVFSLDSVITAVGLARDVEVMVLAILIAVGVMFFFAKPLGDLVEKHPSLKMLALSFLVLVGAMLVAEGFDQHVPKGYLYFAMAFA